MGTRKTPGLALVAVMRRSRRNPAVPERRTRPAEPPTVLAPRSRRVETAVIAGGVPSGSAPFLRVAAEKGLERRGYFRAVRTAVAGAYRRSSSRIRSTAGTASLRVAGAGTRGTPWGAVEAPSARYEPDGGVNRGTRSYVVGPERDVEGDGPPRCRELGVQRVPTASAMFRRSGPRPDAPSTRSDLRYKKTRSGI